MIKPTQQPNPKGMTMAQATCQLFRQRDSEQPALLFSHIWLANTPWRRLKGLLGKSCLKQQEGLLLDPCGRIHTLGMRFALDAVFIDKQGIVLRCVNHLKPQRSAGIRGARYTLELAAGTLSEKTIQVGDRLTWEAV